MNKIDFADRRAMRATDTIRELKKELAARHALLVSILGVLKPSPNESRCGYSGCETCGWHGCDSDLEGCERDHAGECGEPICPSCKSYIESSEELDLVLEALHERVARMVDNRPWPVRKCEFCGVEMVDASKFHPHMFMCPPCWDGYEDYMAEQDKRYIEELRLKRLTVG